ncbi:hypothetical protein CGRA01v4_00574 [Colletotrichum graminicola]|nr:hypothetical protein CGRA01v4_00574 [Colletotrichum graminicola]
MVCAHVVLYMHLDWFLFFLYEGTDTRRKSNIDLSSESYVTEYYRSGRGGGATSECRSASLAIPRLMCNIRVRARKQGKVRRNVMPPSPSLLISPMRLAIGCLWQLTRHVKK